MVVSFREARLEDAEALFADMRPADRREVEAASGPDVLGTLRRSIALSDNCLAAEDGGQLLALFGVAPASAISDTAAPWLLGTEAIRRHERTLMHASRAYIGVMAGVYPVLANWVDARNVASVRLLEWLGFEIHPAEPFGFARVPFHRFELRRHENNVQRADRFPRNASV